MDLKDGYILEEVGTTRLLKRPGGHLLAAFGERVDPGNIRRVAEADGRYLGAVERQERYAASSDAESVMLFSEEVRQARVGYLAALEAAYRG